MCRNNILPFHRGVRDLYHHIAQPMHFQTVADCGQFHFSSTTNTIFPSMQSDLILKLFHKGRKLRHGQFHPCFIMSLLMSRIENNPKLMMMHYYMKELRCGGIGKPCANKENGTFCFLTPHHPAGTLENHNQPINRSASSLFRGLVSAATM